MHRTRLVCATLLAVGSAGISVAAGSAEAAPAGCQGQDPLVAVDSNTARFDTNANGFVCSHPKKDKAPKKPGPPTTSIFYYDDAV